MALVGARTAVAAALLVSLAVPVDGSLSEEASDQVVAYQFDGGSHHDAPDACQQADPQWSVAVGAGTDGMLVPGDDPSDVFVLDVPAALVGSRLDVRVSEAAGTPDLAVNAFAPACAGDVFDLVNRPFPDPAPPQPGPGEQQHPVSGLTTPWDCANSWTLLVTGLNGMAAPPSVHVAWTNGAERTVPLTWSYRSWAIYHSQDDVGILLKGAWANLPSAWSGAFVLLQGDCNAVDGGAVYGLPAMAWPGRVAFTPIRAGPHVVHVSHSGAAPTLSFTLSCHFCIGEVEDLSEFISYQLGVDQA